jgi:hypothetical protein
VICAKPSASFCAFKRFVEQGLVNELNRSRHRDIMPKLSFATKQRFDAGGCCSEPSGSSDSPSCQKGVKCKFADAPCRAKQVERADERPSARMGRMTRFHS